MFLLLNASAILAQNIKMAPITGSFLLCEGESRRLNCATKGGVWESLDSEIISIDEKGMIEKSFGKVRAADNPAKMLEEL